MMHHSLRPLRALLPLAMAALALLSGPVRLDAQTVTGEIEVLRSLIRADRKITIAEAMEFTEKEASAFWPMYRAYRTDMDRVGDALVKLVLRYADLYPQVPEEQAKKLLRDLTTLEKKRVAVRSAHLQKFSKVLPATKVLRLAQLEARMDLLLQLQMASTIPMVPSTPGKR